MAFFGRHGVHPEEKQLGQPFHIDVEILSDLLPAGIKDDLTLTVDYGKVYAVVREIVEKESYNLIEAIAETIARRVLDYFSQIDSVLIRVRKPHAPLPGPFDYVEVEIVRKRSSTTPYY